jgi:hypothetical protein
MTHGNESVERDSLVMTDTSTAPTRNTDLKRLSLPYAHPLPWDARPLFLP